MNKKILFLLVCSLATLTISYAQDSTKSLDLSTQPSPAFVLFGMEPTSVNKPTTPRAVAASFVSAIRQGGAIEVAPYWLSHHTKLTFDDYYNANIGRTLLQTLSFSFASVPRSENADTSGSRIGLGMRCMFAAGRPRDTLQTLHKMISDIQLKYLGKDTIDTAAMNTEIRPIALAMQREDKMRVGFRLEMAMAVAMNFLNDNLSKGKFERWGAWFNGAYLLDKPDIDFLAVARLIECRQSGATQDVADIGARMVSHISDFSFSVEYVQRAEIKRSGTALSTSGNGEAFFLEHTYRLAGEIEYKYNNDISAYMTFGRNYASINTSNAPIVAQVGVNFGFGGIPLLSQK